MMDYKKSPLIFFVNGKKIIEHKPDPEQLLVEYLREVLHLTGTKVGCSEGGCGACTVMISKYDRKSGQIKHFSAIACMTPLCAVHGKAVTTVEGIGSTRDKLHPVQERIAKAHGSQCGFCTPGIVMSMYALLRNNSMPSMKDLETTFQGNLCRCTGYRPILDGYRTFTKEYQNEHNNIVNGIANGGTCLMGEKCCKYTGIKVENKLFQEEDFAPHNPTQEPIFPPELKEFDSLDKDFIMFHGERVIWYRPVTLNQLLAIKKCHPSAKIVAGNTEIGLETKQNLYKVLVNVDQVMELNKIEETKSGIEFGANVCLTDLEKFFNNEIHKRHETETRLYKTINDMLHWFSGAQIRNVATAVGNIMTGSPISDLNPIFLVAEVSLDVAKSNGQRRKVVMNSKFFTGYRKNILDPDDVIVSIQVQKTTPDQYIYAFKQSKRRDDDIAIVNMAINVIFKPGTDKISHLKLAYGGVGPTTVMPLENRIHDVLNNSSWNENFFNKMNQYLSDYFNKQLNIDAPGGEVEYRKSLVLSLFFKSYLTIKQQLQKSTVNDKELSAIKDYEPLEIKTSQLFEKTPDSQPAIDPIGRPEVMTSAFKHSTGEAIYCDDIPRFENELYLAFVLSTKAHAKIISIDATEALKQKGVQAFYCANDLKKENNIYGFLDQDESVFADKEVHHYGQIIGAVIAENKKQAQEAAKLVKVEYEELEAILTLEEAILKKSFFDKNIGYRFTEKGDVEKTILESYGSVDGSVRSGKQEHFYLEPQGTIAVPRDSDELEIFCSTQWPENVQKCTAKLLNTTQSKITVRVKRIGGGFGGKEIRNLLIALPCAFAASKLRRPVRCVLDRDQDMVITGSRNPMLFKYKVGFTKEGHITGLDLKAWLNAGYTADYSPFVLGKALQSVQNAYRIPVVRAEGWVCRTNTVSNTAFRGFGGPQGLLVGEQIMRQVAKFLNMDYVEVMDKNLYREGHVTHFDQIVTNCNVKRCFDECLQNSDYYNRKKTVEEFNSKNRWKKRGISIVPVSFGVGFPVPFLNQAGALVNVYTDGSVLLTHGGVEMGQGLHTKMVQIASRVLEIPITKIHLSETSTDKVPNTTSTAASSASDLNGMAVLNACKVIKDRLAPYKEKYPNESWESWVSKAYMDRVSLSATGFFKFLDEPKSHPGDGSFYFVFGAAVSEVEIDCLTGDHQVRKVDIVMDLGSSLNPAIDVGQIEGAFTQGYGFFTMEEIAFSPIDGRQLTKGPSTYKIPGFNDIPAEMNISLLTGAPNPRAVYSSKAVGEPPLNLAGSVFFAIKEAIIAARKDEGLDLDFEFNAPATAARIRLACQDKFTKQVTTTSNGQKPWSVAV